jgi:hypothetical protein
MSQVIDNPGRIIRHGGEFVAAWLIALWITRTGLEAVLAIRYWSA